MSKLYVNTIYPNTLSEVAISGNLNVSGTLKAHSYQTIVHNETVYSGSNSFGNDNNDIHDFTGSVNITGGSNTGQISGSGKAIFVQGIETAGYLRASGSMTIGSDVSGSGKGIFVGGIETAGDLKVSGSIVYSGFTAHTISGSKGVFVEGIESVGDIQTSGSFTARHGVYATHLSSSGKGYFVEGIETAGTFRATGSATFTDGVFVQQGIISGSGKAYFVGGVETAGNVMVTGTVDCNTLTASHAYIEELDVNKINTTYTTIHEQTLEIEDKRIIIGSGSNGHDTGIIFGGHSGSFAQGTKPGASLIYDYSDGMLLLTGSEPQGNVRLGFYDANIYIGASDDGKLALAADGTTDDAILIDSAGGITLDADGGEVFFNDGDAQQAVIKMDDSSGLILSSSISTNDFHIMSGRDIVLDAAGVNNTDNPGNVYFRDGDGQFKLTISGSGHDGDNGYTLLAAGSDSSKQNLIFSASAIFQFEGDASQGAFLNISSGSAGAVIQPGGEHNDIIFKQDDATGGAEIFRLDNSAASLVMADDKKLYFGTNNDASIEYDEDGTDELIISGAIGGIDIQMPQAAADALTIGSSVGAFMTFNTEDEDESITSAKLHAFSAGIIMEDDVAIYFGSADGGDASIEYNENGDDFMVISGSHAGGLVLSGSNLVFDVGFGQALGGSKDGQIDFKHGGEQNARASLLISGSLSTDGFADEELGYTMLTAGGADSKQQLWLSGSDRIVFAGDDGPYLSFLSASGDITISPQTGRTDIVFADDEETTIFTLKNSRQSILLSATKKIEFADANAYIHHDGTDLKLADDADINLVAGAEILLDAATDINLDADGGEIFFKDGGVQQAVIKMDDAGAFVLSSSLSRNDFHIMSGKDIILDAAGDNDAGGSNDPGVVYFRDGSGQFKLTISGSGQDGDNGYTRLEAGSEASKQDLIFSASAIFQFEGDASQGAFLNISSGSAGAVIQPGGEHNDIIFKQSDPHGAAEVFRLDSSAASLVIADDKKLYFGTGNDAHIEYDEDGTDELIITLPAGGGDIMLPDNDGAALEIKESGDVYMSFTTTDGDEEVSFEKRTAFAAGALLEDAQPLYFGSEGETSITYGGPFMTISGSHSGGGADGGLVFSGSNIIFDVGFGQSGAGAGSIDFKHGGEQNQCASLLVSSSLGSDGLGDEEGGYTMLTAGGPDSKQELWLSSSSDIVLAGDDGPYLSFFSASSAVTVAPFDTDIHFADGNEDTIFSIDNSAGSVVMADDKKLYFGTNNDASIEYDEDGTDELIISGAIGGIDIQMPQAAADALTIGSSVGAFMTFNTEDEDESITSAKLHAFSAGIIMEDDVAIYFGSADGGDASIEYNENGDDLLVISGSHMGEDGGIVLSGTMITFDATELLPASIGTANYQATNLGGSEEGLRWANVYTENLHTGDLHLENEKGSWTIIEDSDFLALRNNKTGKRFKIMMEPIDDEE